MKLPEWSLIFFLISLISAPSLSRWYSPSAWSTRTATRRRRGSSSRRLSAPESGMSSMWQRKWPRCRVPRAVSGGMLSVLPYETSLLESHANRECTSVAADRLLSPLDACIGFRFHVTDTWAKEIRNGGATSWSHMVGCVILRPFGAQRVQTFSGNWAGLAFLVCKYLLHRSWSR